MTPVDLEREEAARLLRVELVDPRYAEARPPWWQEVLSWVTRQLGRLLEVFDAVTGLGWAWLSLLAVLAAVLAVVLWRVGLPSRQRGAPAALFAGRVRSAAEYRARATAAASDGRHDDAVRERFRAVIRTLEERGVLDPRPGRTADEAAREAGVLLPDLATELSAGARVFDDVVYGAHPASPDLYQRLVALDDAVPSARLTPAGVPGTTPATRGVAP